VYCPEPKTKSGTKNKKVENQLNSKTDMLRSIGKLSGESVESVLKKKNKATIIRICRKGRFFQHGMKDWSERVKEG